MHPEFEKRLKGSPTGRLASNLPEMQRLPLRTEEAKELREALRPPEGSLYLDADFSAVELRIYAALAEEDDRDGEESSDDD